MATNIKGLTFDNQLVEAANDGRFYSALLTDGILAGCGVEGFVDQLTIQAGAGIAGGRLWIVPAAVSLQISQSSGYFRAKLVIDLTQTATEDDFEQADVVLEYSPTATFNALVQDDINGSGTTYEMQLCVGSITSGAISGILINPAPAQLRAGTLADGIPLYNGQSLNTLYTPGVYTSANGTISGSLTGVPSAVSAIPFRLIVSEIAAGRYRQTIVPVNSTVDIWERVTASGGTWQSWNRTVTQLAAADAGKPLFSNGASGLTTSGTVPIAQGGTGATSASAALAALGAAPADYTQNGPGTEIPANADLNAYTTPGVYRCVDGTRAGTLLNSPTSSAGFRLDVLSTSSAGYLAQRAIINGGAESLRYYNYAAGTWTDWSSVAFVDAHTHNGAGAEIPSSANLNQYTTPGTYRVPNAGTAATISNGPVSNAGYRLDVFATSTSGYLMQRALVNGGTEMLRYYNYGSSTWTPWVTLLTSADTIPIAQGGTGATTAAAARTALGALGTDYTPNAQGSELPNNANLNQYTTPGTWRCSSIASAATISNGPVSDAGYRLEVLALSSNSYLMQVAYINGGAIKFRYFNGSNSSWGTWRTVSYT